MSLTLNNSVISLSMTVFESSLRAEKNLSLIFEFDEEISEIIGNENDETKLFFEKYKLSEA